jgi:hypothetical protein
MADVQMMRQCRAICFAGECARVARWRKTALHPHSRKKIWEYDTEKLDNKNTPPLRDCEQREG